MILAQFNLYFLLSESAHLPKKGEKGNKKNTSTPHWASVTLFMFALYFFTLLLLLADIFVATTTIHSKSIEGCCSKRISQYSYII